MLTFDDVEGRLAVLALGVDGETRLAAAAVHQTVVHRRVERVRVGDAAVGGLRVHHVQLAGPAHVQHRLPTKRVPTMKSVTVESGYIIRPRTGPKWLI